MKRNFLLFVGVCAAVLLAVNSFKRILAFRDTSTRIAESEAKLEALKKENEKLKQEMQYKLSQEYKEAEIRNKLGLAKPNETVFVFPDEGGKDVNDDNKRELPNWKKWWRLFFET